MSSTDQAVQVYQLRIWIRKISPQIWRRLLVRSDSTIAELHDTLQIAFGWMDDHLHQFFILLILHSGSLLHLAASAASHMHLCARHSSSKRKYGM